MRRLQAFLYKIGYLKKPVFTPEHDAHLRMSTPSDTLYQQMRKVFDDTELVENYNQGQIRNLILLAVSVLVTLLISAWAYMETKPTENQSQTPIIDVYGNR